MNRDKDRVHFGDDVIITFTARVVSVSYDSAGEISYLRVESNNARNHLLPKHLRDFRITAIPDEDYKARWSA